MVVWTLALSSLVSVLMGLLYVLVGRAVTDPGADQEERWARDAFAIWWFGFAGSTILSGTGTAVVAFGLVDVPLHASLMYLQWLFLSAGLAGLLYYLLYVYTGRTGLVYPVAVFYMVFYISVVYAITAMSPVGLDVGEWSVTTEYASDLPPAVVNVLLVALVGPIVVAAGMYLLLFFKVDDAVQKTRIMLVGGAFLLWFGSAGVAVFTGLGDWQYWPLASRVLALAASLIILYAFTRLERRRGVEPAVAGRKTTRSKRATRGTGRFDQAVVVPRDSFFLRS